MATPTADIEIFPKTELQEDWYTQSVGDSASPFSWAVNLDRRGKLTVSSVNLNDASVFNAYRDLEKDGNAVRAWTIDDTQFPSSAKPFSIRSILSPSNATFLSVVSSDNNVYFLDSSSRFPHWKLCENKPAGINATSALPFITRNNVLKICIETYRADNNGQIIYTYDPLEKTWVEDFLTPNNVWLYGSHHVGSAFTQATDDDDSQWGYLANAAIPVEGQSTREVCTAILNPDDNGDLLIYTGSFPTVAYVVVGGKMPRTTPLIFGIAERPRSVTYFQAQGDGTYSAVYPFGTDTQFAFQLEAVFRTGLDVDQNSVEWIDLFALDSSGNLWHTRNAVYDTGRSMAVKRYPNGDIYVPEWETPSIISSQTIKSFHVAKELTGDGHAYVVTELASSSTTGVLQGLVQDMASTGWTTFAVAAIDQAAPDILKRNVYYVELTVRKGGIITPGLAAKIMSTEFCQIDANGVSTSVSSGQFVFTHTNARGLICLTIPADESLACPALSVWVEGMNGDQTIDIQPTGDIQSRFASITVDDLKKAQDQTDQTFIFSQLSDAELDALATSLQQATTAFVGLPPRASGPSSIPHSTTQPYLHPKTSKKVALTRHVSERHMGLISHHRRGQSVRIRLRPNLIPLEDDESTFLKSFNRPTIVSSWGDFWTQVANGIVQVAQIVLTPVENAVEAEIQCVIDGVTKLWNGVASLVHQVFDVIGDLFKSVDVASEKTFNWLAYIFAWDDIKATAVAFCNTFQEQIGKAQDYFDNTARDQLENFFTGAKDWINDNMDTVADNADDLQVGQYDQPQSDPSDGLPSSASWLSNKVDNASKSVDFSSVSIMSDSFNSTLQTFLNKLTDTGISSDFSTALQNASDFFSNLTSRGVLDELTFKSFAQVFKSIAVLFLDFAEAIMETLLDVLVETLKLFKDIVTTPMDIPIISKIFKDLVGLDLTLFNLFAVPMAVPATIFYKSIMGTAPFSNSQSTSTLQESRIAGDSGGKRPKDPLLLWSCYLTMAYGSFDTCLG
ncbi:hypothetical protein BYT27DRAFT_7123094 [Phlegmacium glaucopus]|nr:hypothetical protein BYT27DRAFT_7123094 [Phlegmacium glaucopus]